ncbi:MAG TPA: AzlC family ABC transporter permease [Rhodospirillales bacterium]
MWHRPRRRIKKRIRRFHKNSAICRAAAEARGSAISENPAPEPAPDLSEAFADHRRAFVGGVVEAFRMPVFVVVSSMIGWGSLARDSGFTMGVSVTATATVWGLPGQVAAAELYAVGAPLLAVALASSMANLRFLPMSLSLMALFRADKAAWRWRYLLVALMSVNTWAVTLRKGPSMPAEQRFPFYMGLSLTCVVAGLLGTAAGFYLAGGMPFFITVSLIFLNPVYFVFLFAGVRARNGILALIIGAVLGPVTHLISPEWGLPFCGVIAGTAAYYLDRRIGGGGA